MKTKLTLCFAAYTISVSAVLAQTNKFPATGSVGIGTLTPTASSLLEVRSTTKGVLISRMTSAQRNAIVSPAIGLLVYQTDANKGFYYYDGIQWVHIAPKGQVWTTTGNTGTSPSINFIGTTDAQPLLFKVNNQNAGRLGYNPSVAITAFGYQSLNSNAPTGYYGTENSAFGYQALFANTTGFSNTAVGSGSLFSNKIGRGNTANGARALYSNTQGSWNTAIGNYSLESNKYGSYNTAVGIDCLDDNITGEDNTATGDASLSNNTSGNENAAFGTLSLYNMKTGYGNTAVGAYSGVSADDTDLHNSTAIGYFATVDASNKVRIGNASVTSIGGQVGWSQFSDERVKSDVKENVPGLEFIKALRPVTYHFSVSKEEELLGVKKVNHKDVSYLIESGSTRPEIKERLLSDGESMSNIGAKDLATPKGKYDVEQIQFTGLIAQEVDAAAKKINYDFSGVDKTGKIWGLRYGDFVVPLVKSVQELSQQNDDLKKQNDELRSRLDKLEEAVFQSQSSSQTIELGAAARLEQNMPNPFNNATSIAYYLPVNKGNAYINFYSSNGALLKSVKLANTGKGTINVKANELPSAVYRYALLVDGKVIDSKQMIESK